MAKKSDILKCIKTTAEFLGNSDRPSVCTLRVDSLSTLSRNTKGVQYSRKSLRAFAKAILTYRQKPRDWTSTCPKTGKVTSGTTTGLYILKDVNIKALKDSQLSELLSATNPNGVSKYYSSLRKMAYDNILEEAIEAEAEPEAKPQKKTTKKARKPKASKKAKPKAKLTKAEEKLFDGDNLADYQPKAEKAKPKASKAKKAVPKGTVTLDAVINGKKMVATLPKASWENSNHSQWEFQANSRNIPTLARSKKELAILCGVYDSIYA